MNSQNLAVPVGIGILCVLLSTSLYLQFQQQRPLTIEDVRSAITQDFTDLDENTKKLSAELFALQNDLGEEKQIVALTSKIDTLAETVEALKEQGLAASKAAGDLASQSGGSGKLSQWLGNVQTDAKEKLAFDEAVRSAVPQRKWGTLFVSNESSDPRPLELLIDTKDGERLLTVQPNSATFLALPVGTFVSELDGRPRFEIKPPDFVLHLKRTPTGVLLNSHK